MKKGLVLEGGAMRGMYTAGVIDVLLENKIRFDGTIGVSAGAVFGCNYKSKQIGRVIRYNKRFCRDPRYVGIRSLIFSGNLYNEKFCYHEVPEKLDIFDYKTFSENPSEFYIVCTDVHTGKPIYHKCTDGGRKDIEWMRASASMPLVSKVVSIDGYDLLDGGISDSIPIEWFRSIGYMKNLVVLTRPENYRKKKTSMGLMNLILKKYPNLLSSMENRYINYNNTLDKLKELESEGNTFIIRPSRDLHVKRTENDPQKLEALYQLGRADALEKIDDIKEFLV